MKHKAIRDRIPEYMNVIDKNRVSRVIDAQFAKLLEEKIDEEVAEYKESKSKEEMGDILEVLFRIIQMNGWTLDEVLDIMDEKRERNGGFENNLALLMGKEGETDA